MKEATKFAGAPLSHGTVRHLHCTHLAEETMVHYRPEGKGGYYAVRYDV